MSNVVRFQTKGPTGGGRLGVAIFEADPLAIKSLQNSWRLIVGDLRQMEAGLATCRCVLQAMDNSPEKEQSMNLLTEAEIELQRTAAKCAALLAVYAVSPKYGAE